MRIEHTIQVWKSAGERGYTIVTQDSDYSEFIEMEGFPPKVVWIRRGNCSTSEIETLLRTRRDAVEALASDSSVGLLALV